jgi:hypothetical protein
MIGPVFVRTIGRKHRTPEVQKYDDKHELNGQQMSKKQNKDYWKRMV